MFLPPLLALAPLVAQAADGPPNIILIYGDDHAQTAISAYGSGLCKTPQIDQLASEGMRFTQSFVTNSICGPCRAVVLTGLHSHLNGKMTNGGGFDQSLPTFAKGLGARGYQTAMIGKWHIKSPPEGFDHWMWLSGSYYSPTWRTKDGKRRTPGYATDLIGDEAVQWLREGRDPNRSFMLWVSHTATHRTWEPAVRHLSLYDGVQLPEPATLLDDYSSRSPAAAAAQMRISRDLFPAYDLKLPVSGAGILDGAAQGRLKGLSPQERAAWDKAYEPRNVEFAAAGLEGEALVRWKYQRYIKDYLRCVAGLDESVGRILDTLDELDLTRETIVIYTSDQGFFLGEHGWYDKRWMYEPSMRTPMIVRWPGVTQPGSTCDELVQNLDLAPTLLEMGEAESVPAMQGRSLVGLLGGEKPEGWRDDLYYHYHQRDSGRTSHCVEPHYGIRTNRHKLIYLYGLQVFELYDLEKDPDEVQNLFEDAGYAAVRTDLLTRLAAARLRYEDGTGAGWGGLSLGD